MIEDILIIDDIFNTSHQDFLENFCLTHVAYKYKTGTGYEDDELFRSVIDKQNTIEKDMYEGPQFVSISNEQMVNFHSILYKLQEYFNFSFYFDIIRVKCNFQQKFTKPPAGKFNPPHVDLAGAEIPPNAYTILYYVNDSDGDTFFFNERYTGIPIKNLTIRKQVPPKKGRCVIFNANIFHAGNHPTQNDRRLAINLNIQAFPNKVQNHV